MLSSFAFQVHRNCAQAINFENKRFLLAVSGGTDSMALLPLFKEFEQKFACQVAVATVHHGTGGVSDSQKNFRFKSIDHVQVVCKKLGWDFLTNDPELVDLPVNPDESDYRKLRRAFLEAWAASEGSDYIVLAQHSEDQFETRLIRLIRGTGIEGMQAMLPLRGIWFRPLLVFQKSELIEYAEARDFAGLLDPENSNPRYLRNWLRNEWLPQLESYRPGATNALSRSLQLFAKSSGRGGDEWAVQWASVGKNGELVLDRKRLKACGREEQSAALSWYTRIVCGQSLSNGQIQEVIKRLETQQKQLSFDVGRCEWKINAEHVRTVPFAGPATL